MNKTKIEYLDYTWNPLAMRCTPVSEGCANCWHLDRADMLAVNPKISEDIRPSYAGDEGPQLIVPRLNEPLKVRKPSRIGVQLMGDLFHEDVTDKVIDRIISSVAYDSAYPLAGFFNNPEPHTYLILTKRPQRILDGHPEFFARWDNIWLGVTVENQENDWRIGTLSQIPAAVRFVSLEPLLSKIRLYRRYVEHIDWVIIGCESGPGRRPCKLEWVKYLVDYFKSADKPVFIKQLNIDGKVSKDPAEWPTWARIREYPK